MNVGLSLGSNFGERLRNLQRARDYLVALSSSRSHLQSPVYETAPIDCPPGSQAFLNAVIEIDFTDSPRALLEKTQAYERAHGRATQRAAGINAPRTIDIDILYFGATVLKENGLTIPHARMMARRFVLLPLSIIRPELVIPGTRQTVRSLLQELPGAGEDVKFVQQEW